jgi:hypothetical protein
MDFRCRKPASLLAQRSQRSADIKNQPLLFSGHLMPL